ncbi:PAS domain-containing sensor histidine kinase [Pontibacter cellulosilyticus]|uniref:histidine kinase n=1 Tax=Pontibacter cellulosilyticus TaxID=1720253 RepID=A0A923N4E5_9BACT|nr:PAS domain-containing sensor histidine kinase [Pontibacter cellulosilyticus]MBC5992028.1 PAS domain S-box protein [Pontibacter cellulosilyticus]
MSLLPSDFYRHLLVNSTDLLTIIGEDGIYRYVGESIEPWLGFKPEELVGTCAFDLVHPDDLPMILEAFQQIATCEKMQISPFRYKTKYDGWRWLECTASNQVHNESIRGYITNSRDITETIEERSRKDLHQAYYQSLFQEHPDAVFSLDTYGYFKSVNKQFFQILSYPVKEMLHAHFTEFVHREDINRLRDLFLQTVAGKSHATELKVVDATGKVKVTHITLLPVYLRGTVIGVQGIAKDITETVYAQQLIRDHSEQLRRILDSVAEPFFALDADWKYTFANQAHCNFLGVTPSYLEGKNIWELYPHMARTEFFRNCHEVVLNGKPAYLEENYPLDDNITLSYSIFPFEGGIAISFIDVTAQIGLKREMEKLSLVASKTINGVVIMNPDGSIEWVNDGFTRLTGYNREEVIGIWPSKLLQGEDTNPETSNYIRQKYQEQVYFTSEVLNYRKSGEPYWVNIDVTPIKNEENELVNYVAIQTDITEKKKAEAELIKLADDLYKQNLNLQQFTYIISHNLRAPVANALGLAKLVNKVELGSPQFNSILEKLELSIFQLDNVIKDINNILSVRDANKTLPREKVNILSIINEVLHPFQDELLLNKASVRLNVDSSFEMLSNKAYLYSIIQNLVSNAIKYQAPERPLELSISVEKDTRGYEFNVSDNGLGMEMQVVENQLFKLYKRFHPNTHGKGIGLFLVKTQVETIGGKIIVNSAPGVGTTFKLLLGANHV